MCFRMQKLRQTAVEAIPELEFDQAANLTALAGYEQ